MWRASSASASGAMLVLLLDSCFSGEWVAAAQAKGAADIVVQAACGRTEACKDSAFTPAFLSFQGAERSREQSMAQLSAKQMTPCVYAPWKDAAKHAITCASQSFSMKLLA